jgi:hypothetical protein
LALVSGVPTLHRMTYHEWQLEHYKGIRPANEADLRAAWDAATIAASRAYAASELASTASEVASDASEVALKASAKATMLTAELANVVPAVAPPQDQTK